MSKSFLPLVVELEADEKDAVQAWLKVHSDPKTSTCEHFRHSVLENRPERWGEKLQYVLVSLFPPKAAIRCLCGEQFDFPKAD